MNIELLKSLCVENDITFYEGVYKENKKIIDILSNMKGKIKNKENIIDEWFQLYQPFMCYLRFILSVLLNCKPSMIGSFGCEVSNLPKTKNINNRMTLALEYNITADNLDDLVLIEDCINYVRHSFDSDNLKLCFKKNNKKVYNYQIENYRNFNNLSDENKNKCLNNIINFICKVNLKKSNLEKLNNIILNNYNQMI